MKKGAGIFETRNVGQISDPVYLATPLDIAPFQAAEFSDAKTGVHTEKKPKRKTGVQRKQVLGQDIPLREYRILTGDAFPKKK